MLHQSFEAQNEPGGFPVVDEELKDNGVTSVKQHRVIDTGKDRIGNENDVAGECNDIVQMAQGCVDIDHSFVNTMLAFEFH